ncbi:MAG: hypothetical protein LBQ70_02230 [Prevotellaceae bacterium]|nr:hypothetical protein [Prevotellaceae bacterium]
MTSVIEISLMITAIHICCRDGMIFSEPRIFVQNRLCRRFGHRISAIIEKPLFACLVCMSSVWGLAGCIALNIPASEWIFTILQVCGLNSIITYFVKE